MFSITRNLVKHLINKPLTLADGIIFSCILLTSSPLQALNGAIPIQIWLIMKGGDMHY